MRGTTKLEVGWSQKKDVDRKRSGEPLKERVGLRSVEKEKQTVGKGR